LALVFGLGLWPWSLVFGLGLWSLVFGLWSLVFGLWSFQKVNFIGYFNAIVSSAKAKD
jgi:hypothetical protein